jgi:hypothetical protein
MKMTKRGAAFLMVLVLVVAMAIPACAASKKEDILSAMQSAATEIGVENSEMYLNSYNSVKNYEGTITDEQYEKALATITSIKKEIQENGGSEVVRQNSTLMNKLINEVIDAAAAVGVTVVYDGNGAGHVVTEGTASNPIKQTGINYTVTYLTLLAAVAAVGVCFTVARKRDLFA